MLQRLVHQMDDTRFESEVVSLMDIGTIGPRLRAEGITVHCLHIRSRRDAIKKLVDLVRLVKSSSPDLIQTWLYQGNFLGGVAGKLGGNIPVVWSLQNSNLSKEYSKKTTIWIAKICGILSRCIPKAVICCSSNARRIHEDLGYVSSRMLDIPNGVNQELFKADPEARLAVRRQLKIPQEAFLVAMIARFDPQKDHHNFVQGAAELHRHCPNVHFLLVGKGATWENDLLTGWIREAGLEEFFHLIGLREDIPQLTAAVDVASLTSAYGDASPLILGEAMACEVPCVATDVGDCKQIIGDTGFVVPIRDPKALGEAWRTFAEMPIKERQLKGVQARKRILEGFSLDHVTRQYENLYLEVLENKH